MRALIIDNYDSFTHNLFQMFAARLSDTNVAVHRPPHVTKKMLRSYDLLVFSPGPGHPREAHLCFNVLRTMPDKPVLGVCLGHQVIGMFYGYKIAKAHSPMHGKVSKISHSGARLFEKLPQPIDVARYHSLVVQPQCGSGLSFDAYSTDDHAVMALSSHTQKHFGVQFHPESFLTGVGGKIIDNFLQQVY